MTPKFIKTSVRKSESLGEKLAKKRASLGYEIKDVERSIRIRANHLEYIENGEWEKLPPDVYVRGFLKSYAKFLRLNPDKVIVLYLKEKGLKESAQKATTIKTQEQKQENKKKGSKVIVTPKKLALLSAAIAGVAILGYISWQIIILTAPPKLILSSPADNLQVTDDNIIVEGITDSGAEVFINNIPVGVSPEGSFKETVSLQEGINLIKVSAKNRLDKETEVSRTIVAELAEVGSNVAQENGLLMKIEIGPNSTSLYLEADGKEVKSNSSVMLPGSTQIIEASDSIVVRASDPVNVNITLNGKDLGKLSDKEDETEREYTKEST